MNLSQVLAQTRADINQQLEQLLQQRQAVAAPLNEAMHYALVLGGKRVRPFLTLQVGALCGAPMAMLQRASLAIECIHAYSLVHDDLPAMDDDALRRGHPTCHIAFDEATAILAGDALQTLAFELISEADAAVTPAQQLQMVQMLAQASGDLGMCGGQALDLSATGKALSETELAQVHIHKTGALIQAAVKLGVLCGSPAAQHYLADFDEFAYNLGLAFQVQDDILDVIGDTAALGKQQGSDVAADKATYVRLLGLEGAIERRDQLHQKALHALARIPYNTEVLEAFADHLLNRNH
ncbi:MULTISPECIES: (2E,6E)-farnesyl diphosphate synthase [Idiomarina]|uniref:(2E,6E)-farnesyl diphosphate synthase n=1 Tax=Idiomarina TaxID=135575 RepID=UPI00138A37A9|nr:MULTISPECIES: farnesyl diphosphate synthase [Idiomarina]MRJ41584.1 (2E,6E)-farnesyl diphosphate synthase [Idiomarina sp. FeN1]NCU57574.1 (2E,6E)-farnesyl diphosphate synthase [Idiomarina sp. FenA--70]NCU60126.1 (2E,6E)-farnesyl diphosphate synthase [Idiomarina sp. FenBw--71]UUN13779.1 (2E,6E)-farnesyl diphosphate synthase [Idiomarina loihiensis]